MGSAGGCSSGRAKCWAPEQLLMVGHLGPQLGLFVFFWQVWEVALAFCGISFPLPLSADNKIFLVLTFC